MSVARVTELSCTSSESFEDAIRQGVARAQRTLRGVRGAWIKEQRVNVGANGEIEFRSWITMFGAIGDARPELLTYEPLYRGLMGQAVACWNLQE